MKFGIELSTQAQSLKKSANVTIDAACTPNTFKVAVNLLYMN